MGIYPITFSIQNEKIVNNIPLKSKLISNLIPGNKQTYIYNTEKEYYEEYQKSLFATTTSKSGWDCMRHYEILGSGIVPYFFEIENKPTTIMCDWPIHLQLYANRFCENLFEKYSNNDITNISDSDMKKYYKIQKDFNEWVREKSLSNIYFKILQKHIN